MRLLLALPVGPAGCSAAPSTGTAAPTDAAQQADAVQYLEMDGGLPKTIAGATAVLADAAGSLEQPSIELDDASVERARNRIHEVCSANGFPVGVLAQGG